MRATARLGVYAAGLALVFGGAAAGAGALVPAETVEEWKEATEGSDMEHEGDGAGAKNEEVSGPAMSRDGYSLSDLKAPGETGEDGRLSFSITAGGESLTEYQTEHGKDLHLIVVRSDGKQFRHVHPTMDDSGVWSLPWAWDEAGSYRVYADFTAADTSKKPSLTLSSTVEVGGDYAPEVATETSLKSTVDGYDVALRGDLYHNAGSELTVEVTRDGEPVKELEPYLGAFGHLVALRQGDLAYLHVHPEGDAPGEDERDGPDVTFMTEAPTPGRYLLYFDFKIDGEVRTATFTVDASESDSAGDGHGGGHGGH